MMDTLTAIANVPSTNMLQQQPISGFVAPVSPIQAVTNFLNSRVPQQTPPTSEESETPLGYEMAGQQQYSSGGVDHLSLWQAAVQGMVTLPLTTLTALTRPLRVVSQGLEESGFPPLAFRGFQEVDLPPPEGPLGSFFETMSAMPLLLPDLPALGALNPASWTPDELSQIGDYLRNMLPLDGRLVIPGLGVFSVSATPQPFNINRPAWADMPWAGPLNPAAFVPATSTVNVPFTWEPIEGPAPAAFNKPLLGPLNPANAYTEPPLPMPNTFTGILDQISDTTPQVAPIISAIESLMDQASAYIDSSAQAPAASDIPELTAPESAQNVAESVSPAEDAEPVVPDNTESAPEALQDAEPSEAAEIAPEAAQDAEPEVADVANAADGGAGPDDTAEVAAVDADVSPTQAGEPSDDASGDGAVDAAGDTPGDAAGDAADKAEDGAVGGVNDVGGGNELDSESVDETAPEAAESAEPAPESAGDAQPEVPEGEDSDFGGSFGEVADARLRRLAENSERILRGNIINNLMSPPREAILGGMGGTDVKNLGEAIFPHPLQAMQPLFNFVRQPFGGDSPPVVQKVRNIWGDVVRPISHAEDSERLEAFNSAAFDPRAYRPRERFVQSVQLDPVYETELDGQLTGQFASPWDEEV